MAEHIRTTHIDQPSSNTVVIEREVERPADPQTDRRSGKGWAGLLIILLVLVAGVIFAAQFLENDRSKSDAIANAADEVGAAAKQIGDAAETASKAARDAVPAN